MGVPVGTGDYIEEALVAHVGGLLLAIAARDYFTLHGQWTLLRIQRPVYLQRLLQLRHGGVAFSQFDRAVTDKVLDVIGVAAAGRTRARARARGRPALPTAAALRRGSAGHRARVYAREGVVPLPRQHRSLLHRLCGERRADIGGPTSRACSGARSSCRFLPSRRRRPVPPTDDGVASLILREHVLGSVPDASVLTSQISGDPDSGAAVPRSTAKHLATDRALTADLILRDSEHQHDKYLPAHVLSSSCANSGVVVQSASTGARRALPPDPCGSDSESPASCRWSSGGATARAAADRGTLARGWRGSPRATSPTSGPAHRSLMSPCTDSTAGAGG
jgi:hypothetical protein